MSLSLVLFQDNLRLADNPALASAIDAGDAILPLYILDDETPGAWRLGGASRWWLHHSLEALSRALKAIGGKLTLRHGETIGELKTIFESHDVSAVYFQRGYAPWSANLEAGLKALCDDAGVSCKRYGGHLLFEPETIRTKQGNPYTVFSPFWRACQEAPTPAAPLPAPKKIVSPSDQITDLSLEALDLLPKGVDWTGGLAATWTPGEKGARNRLLRFIDNGLEGYKANRDKPADPQGTSYLSPHLRFGEISPRMIWGQVMSVLDQRPSLSNNGMHFLRELAWREFSYHLLFNTPDLPEHPLRDNFAQFPWGEVEPTLLKQWQKGKTGFPIVDAGMRQLWETGYMHNRVRMIVASFLVKDLLVHWREGENWFWDTLVDADIANNSASWQWVAGCGADAAPYFRIFNPVLQGEKFDPSGDYVRRFVPELRDLPEKYIHKPWEAPRDVLAQAGVTLGDTYPEPMVDRKITRQRALDAYATIKKAG